MSNKHSGSSKMKAPPKKTNEDIEKLDHRSHILKLPDTYLGSIEMELDVFLGRFAAIRGAWTPTPPAEHPPWSTLCQFF